MLRWLYRVARWGLDLGALSRGRYPQRYARRRGYRAGAGALRRLFRRMRL